MHKRMAISGSESRGEREEELALFHEVRRRERERKSNAVHPLPLRDADLMGSSYTFMQHQRASSTAKFPLTQTSSKLVYDPLPADLNKKDDDLLTAELGKNDYDWLLTPPGTPLINSLDHNSVSEGDDFLSRAVPVSSVRTLAAIKTSRFSSTKAELNLKDGVTLSSKPDLALRRGQNGLTRSNGSINSSLYTSNNGTHTVGKKTMLTPGSRSSSRPTSPTKRPISAHTSRPTTPTSRPKPSSAPGSHPTTPTSRTTTAVSSRSGSSSVSSSSMITRKTGASSPAMTPVRRLSGLQPQSQSMSVGVSRSSSASKARPLPSRSVPSSRGSSPTTVPFEWHQATATPALCSESEGLRTSLTTHLTTNSSAKTSLTTPHIMNSRGSLNGSLSRQGATSSTTQAVFSSLNQSATCPDISRKACSPSMAITKSALFGLSRAERLSSNSFIMSSVQMTKSHNTVAPSPKDVDKVIQHSRRSLVSSPSPEMWSTLQTKYLYAKSISPTSSRDHGGFNKQAPCRSLDLTMQHVSLHQSTSNGLCSLVSSTPLLSSRHTDMQNCSNNFSSVSNSNASADYITISSFEQDDSKVGEAFPNGSNFLGPPAGRSDHLSSLVKDARINNWLGSQDYMDENLMQVFEQGKNKFEKCESPLVCPHGGGGGAVNCDLCNVKMRLQMLNEKSKVSFGASSQILGEA